MKFKTFTDQSNELQDQIWSDPKIRESLRNLGILDRVDSMCAYVKQLEKSMDAWAEIERKTTMKLKFEGGPLDGLETEHDKPGWEAVTVVKYGEDCYRLREATHLKQGETIIATTAMAFLWTEDQTLHPGETARLFTRDE